MAGIRRLGVTQNADKINGMDLVCADSDGAVRESLFKTFIVITNNAGLSSCVSVPSTERAHDGRHSGMCLVPPGPEKDY